MTRAWSREEVEALVADYFAMLRCELVGIPYNKTEHRRRLGVLLRNRSEPSIEFKYANLSAVLVEAGFPFIAGYKPRGNYQRLLRDVAGDRLRADTGLIDLAAADADRAVTIPTVDDILKILEKPPGPAPSVPRAREVGRPYFPLPVNYLEREARNQALGAAGEEFILNFERARLIRLGAGKLAGQIEHTAKTRGDAEGYDILSFEASGRDRLIEVKTTKYRRETPFFVSGNELRVSEDRADRYHLYRLFAFRDSPRLFTLPGALSRTCRLEPRAFIATVA